MAEIEITPEQRAERAVMLGMESADTCGTYEQFLMASRLAVAQAIREAEAALIATVEGRIAELETQLKITLDRESASQARHDEQVAKLEAENARHCAFMSKAQEQAAHIRLGLACKADAAGAIRVLLDLFDADRAALGGNDD